MADTLYTKDGHLHVLIGGTTLESVIREYAGDDAADAVQTLTKYDAYERARAETDLANYELALDSNNRCFTELLDCIRMVNIRNPKEALELLEDMKRLIRNQI